MKTLEGMGYSNKTGLLTEVVAENDANILNTVKLLEESKPENPKKILPFFNTK